MILEVDEAQIILLRSSITAYRYVLCDKLDNLLDGNQDLNARFIEGIRDAIIRLDALSVKVEEANEHRA